MYYTTHQLVDLFTEGNTELQDITFKSIFLKENHTASPRFFSVNIAKFILTSLEKNTYNFTTITEMLNNIISSQCTDTGSIYFGLFPYSLFLTEKDYVQPDYDFQPLLLLPLLKCYLEFQHIFPQDIMTRLTESITLTTNVISYNSNLIDSHNKLQEIILMICVGETFAIPQFVNSAVTRAKSYYYFIKNNRDMPPEYNSPDLIISQLEAIDYFYMYINNQDVKNIVNTVKNILLSILYRHFNPHLFQWTGPFSICPSKFITNNMLNRLSEITAQKDTEKFTIPNEYHHLSPLYENKFEQLFVSRGIAFPNYKHHLVASIYNTRTFSFCSFNHDDLWHRRMPCIGYFGDRESPYCLYIQCLLNGISFSSASFHSIQHKELLLGHINFSTNRGYVGIAFDKSDIYKTKDLRIRFCLEGNINNLKVTQNNKTLKIVYRKLIVLFDTLYAEFNNNEIKYEFTTLNNALYFDIILYNGKEIDLELSKIESAIAAFSLYVGKRNNLGFTPKTYEDKHFLYSETCIDGLEIKLKSHKKPDKYEVIFTQDSQYISDMDIASYIDNINTFTNHHDFFFENKNNSQSLFLKENNLHNNIILEKISEIEHCHISNIVSETKKIFYLLDAFSVTETKHYSVMILHQLYELAKKTDKRFIRLIDLNYTKIYKQLKTMTDKKKIKKIILDTAKQITADYTFFKSHSLSTTTSIIEDIVKIVQSEFKNPDLSLQSISTNYGLSESYLSRKFSEYLGISYVKYLTQTRINAAVEILNSDPDTTDIHIHCGYYNRQTFDNAFKKVTGISPAKFLKNINNAK